MKKAFVDYRPTARSLELIEACNSIIERYQGEGYRLTLRQLYYQLVSANIVANTERSYKSLGNLLSKARLAGLVDWDAIEDRIRQPREQQHWASPQSIMSAAVYGYRLDRWEGQPNAVELWVEKDALAGVLEPIAKQHHVTLMVNRGYSSQSAMYDAAGRIWEAQRNDRDFTILYLGDLDPSGEDMVRDIDDRLNSTFGAFCTIKKLAITPAQVEEHQPPPNPAKMSDSRAAAFVAEHGYQSYEVDALPPSVLSDIINDAILDLIEDDTLDDVLAQERRDRQLMEQATKDIMAQREEDE